MANGIAFPSLPAPGEGEPAPVFAAGVDPGMVTYDMDGELRAIELLSGWASLQYWIQDALWVAGTYSHLDVRNSDELDAAAPALARKSLDWFGACVGYDPTEALRFVAGYSFFRDEYVDGEVGKNHRMGLTGFLFF